MNIAQKVIVILTVLILYPVINFVILLKKAYFNFFVNKEKQIQILLINNAKIGDMVCVTPVFRAIKQHFSKSFVFMVINPKTVGILKNNPHIDEIIFFGETIRYKILLFYKLLKRNIRYSVVMVPGTMNYILPFLLCIPVRSVATATEYGLYYRMLAILCSSSKKRFYPNTLSVKHYLDLLNPLGVFNSNLKKEVYFSDIAKTQTLIFLKAKGWNPSVKLVGFSLSAGNIMKQWPPEDFMRLANMIYDNYRFIPVFIGSPADKDLINDSLIYLDKKIPYIVALDFSLENLPALISCFDFFISVDTGTLYIANALDVPVVDIAGPCNIYDQMPIYEKCEVVYVKDLPGWPYSSVLHTLTKLTKEQMKCITDINPVMVFDSFKKLHAKYGTR